MKIVLQKDQKIWFTSDTHYGHANICRATSKWENSFDKTRDFSSLDKMNSAIVDSINSKVGQNDILFHLGDWSFGGFEKIEEFRNRIICKNVHLILGNHDHHIERNRDDIMNLFSSVHHYLKLDLRVQRAQNVEKFPLVLMHFPIASWDGMNDGVIHLHGHTHLSEKFRISKGRSMDVGVDGNNLSPLSLEEVLSLLKNRPVANLSLPKDHHVI